jgi:integrating conjugative element membrane protein (TIGR03745 family)
MFRKLFTSSRALLVSIWTFLSFLSFRAWAVLPNAEDIADGANTASPLQWFRDMGQRGVTMSAVIVSGITVLGVGAYIFSSFKDSRDKNDWGKFGITFAVGVLVVATVVIFSILAVQYVTPADA